MANVKEGPRCKGKGSCPQCGGTGRQPGFTAVGPCKLCDGKGKCPRCNGSCVVPK